MQAGLRRPAPIFVQPARKLRTYRRAAKGALQARPRGWRGACYNRVHANFCATGSEAMNELHATVSGIFISRQRGAPMQALQEATIVADWGLEQDRKARAGSKRQVYLVDEGTLRSVDLQPGDLNENITVKGLDVNTLQAGQRVRLGDAVLEITMPCTVCGELEKVRAGLKEALRDRRGVLAHVLETGVVRLGDRLIIE